MNYRIGIDLGGTGVKAGIVNENYEIIHSHYQPTPAGQGFEAVVEAMAQATEAVAAKAGLTLSDFPCVGVGTPSCINPFTGRLVFSGNINLKDVPLRDALEHRLGRPVYIGNDANCAIIGEALAGGAKDCQNVLMLTLGTGVGGGVILNGKLFAGADGMGTELGHIPLIAGGEHCSCGTDGCLEAYASVTALIRQTKAAMEAHPESSLHAHVQENGPVNGKTVFDCAQAGDAVSQQVIDQYIDYLARGIGGLVNIFRPEVVLIGGGLSGQGENLLAPLREACKQYVFASDIIGQPEIRSATLGNGAGTIGAAYLDRM